MSHETLILWLFPILTGTFLLILIIEQNRRRKRRIIKTQFPRSTTRSEVIKCPFCHNPMVMTTTTLTEPEKREER